MKINRSLRHHSLRSQDLLPFYDSVFAVAFTLLAYNLPDRISDGRSDTLLDPLGWYLLTGTAVFLYWLKLRRLVLLDRVVQLPQLALVGAGLLIVVLIPKLASLVLSHGVGAGSLFHWTLPQIVNTTFLGLLLLFNLFCLLYALGLRRRRNHQGQNNPVLRRVVSSQWIGMAGVVVLMGLQLLFPWFDNEYVFLMPLILVIEEAMVLRLLQRGRQA
ncbi:MAG: hypothetical protein VKJ44_08920 [Synechococcus sp.]|nr:hypothetical protein [Synechococcus sp.]